MCGSSVSVALLMCGSAGSAGSVDVWQCGVWETGRQSQPHVLPKRQE